MILGGPLGPWQALLMSPKGRNASRDGFVNLNISLNSIASFGSLTPVGLALLLNIAGIPRMSSVTIFQSDHFVLSTNFLFKFTNFVYFGSTYNRQNHCG